MLNDSQSNQESSSMHEGKSPHLKIEIEDDEGNKVVYSAISSEINIGRGEENHIRLTQRNVSRQHVKLYVQPDGESVIAQDMESYLGVYLNGRKINEKCQLRVGEYLNIGDYMISLKLDSDIVSKSKVEVEYLQPNEQAKLVAVSSNLAGKKFSLDRKELMIGRVEEENEIVINHRSISRTHAKIIHRQGEFILLDMGSSNGITLNNESNVKTSPLRNGDLIVMGMVKLRFVAPGDDYVFNPKDIDDQNLDKSQSHKDVMFIIMLLLTALISAWLVSKYLVRQKNTESPATIEIQKPTMPNPELEPAPMEDAVAPNDQKAESQSVVDAGIDPKKEEIDQALAPENTTNTETAPTETEVNSGEETLKSSKSKKKKTKAQEEK